MSLTDDLRQFAVVHRRDGTVTYKASADRLTPVTTSDFAAPAASTTTRSDAGDRGTRTSGAGREELMATLRQSVITERVMALRAARDGRAVCVPCLAALADTAERLMRTELPGEARQRRDEREADLQDVAKRLAGTFSSHVDGESGRQMIRK